MIEFISMHLVVTYFVAAFAFAIIELRIDGVTQTATSPDEAFWLAALVMVLFPFAVIRRMYIVASHLVLWAITPSTRKQRKAAMDKVSLILTKIKKDTSQNA